MITRRGSISRTETCEVETMPLLSSNWVLCSYIPHDVLQGVTACLPEPFPPHKFIQITGELVPITSFHSLQFCFDAIPITLHSLCVHACCRVYKMKRVIHKSMSCDRWECIDRAISSQLIRMDGCSGGSVSSDNWQECACIPCWNNLHVS